MACGLEELSILFGWVVVSCVGSASHFLYKWLGCISFIELFVAVNESVWEHLKLLVWPLLCWWLVSLIWREFDDCLQGLVLSEIYSVCTMLAVYYTYMGISAYESLVIDILIFLLSVFTGLLVAETSQLFSRFCLSISAVLFFIGFVTLSLARPSLPLFFDKNHSTYGPVC